MEDDYKLLTKFLMSILCVLMSITSTAQTNLSDNVKTNSRDPLHDQNDIAKGTAQGTTTDAQGKFQLDVNQADAVLTFSFIGYKNQEITVGNRTTLDVSLEEDVQSLDEVVVVGYGTVKKSDLTGSVSSVKSDA